MPDNTKYKTTLHIHTNHVKDVIFDKYNSHNEEKKTTRIYTQQFDLHLQHNNNKCNFLQSKFAFKIWNASWMGAQMAFAVGLAISF